MQATDFHRRVILDLARRKSNHQRLDHSEAKPDGICRVMPSPDGLPRLAWGARLLEESAISDWFEPCPHRHLHVHRVDVGSDSKLLALERRITRRCRSLRLGGILPQPFRQRARHHAAAEAGTRTTRRRRQPDPASSRSAPLIRTLIPIARQYFQIRLLTSNNSAKK